MYDRTVRAVTRLMPFLTAATAALAFFAFRPTSGPADALQAEGPARTHSVPVVTPSVPVAAPSAKPARRAVRKAEKAPCRKQVTVRPLEQGGPGDVKVTDCTPLRSMAWISAIPAIPIPEGRARTPGDPNGPRQRGPSLQGSALSWRRKRPRIARTEAGDGAPSREEPTMTTKDPQYDAIP